MKINKRATIGLSLIVVLLLTLVTPVWGQTPITHMRNVAVQVLSVTAGLTTDDLTTTDDAVVGDDLTVVDDAILSSDLTLTPAATISVTMNATISPAGSYQPLSSAGTVNTASITAGTAGDVLILENTTNTSIVLTDTGTLKLGGNRTLGQFDTLSLISDGTNWIETAFANN